MHLLNKRRMKGCNCSDVTYFYTLSASLPALAQLVDFASGDSFMFHTQAWFPLAITLNLFFPTEADLPKMATVRSKLMLSFSVLCLLFYYLKFTALSMINFINFKDSFYFWSIVLANSHVIVALFLIGFKRPEERHEQSGALRSINKALVKMGFVDDDDATCFKYQVTCILLVSPFLKLQEAERSTNAMLFRLCGMGIILLICVLPWMSSGWEFRIRVLNLSSAYFLVFLLLVFELKDSPVYSLLSCLKFILLCSFFVFYDGTARMMRDMASNDDCQFQTSETPPEEIVEEESQPIVFPDKITQQPDPVLVSSKPTSPHIISLNHAPKSTWANYSIDMVSELHKVTIHDENEEHEVGHDANLVPADCISYCSLFPADYEFTRDMMVWSWMAAEIVKSDSNDEMEEVGIKCFDALVARKFIVLSGFDSLSDQMTYKLGNNDNVFFNEQNLRLQYRKILDNCTNLEELEHLSLISTEINQDHFEILKKCNNLKTLLLHKCNMSELGKSLNGMFLKLKLLTTLDLSCTNIAELSSSVENLSSLKCLDLSRTPIRWLPVSIESLSNLETLILLGCRSLHCLPRGMSKLTNLQHLSFDVRLQLNAMPMGIGRLAKLKSLRAFPVGRKDGNRIGELRGMSKLKGSLCICKLENILNVEEAEMALLGHKQLTELELLWSDHDPQDAIVTVEEEILENLRPHFGLQKLKIGFFSGGILPSWISNPCFDQMISITLSWCRYCERLPTLGELPSLKFLSVFEMSGVVDIDIFFGRKLGNEDIPAFPKLEKLSIEGMSNLVKWTGVGDCDFASLVHLAIKYCPQLVSLPCMSYLNSLQHLEISYCDELVFLPEVGGSFQRLVVKECPKLVA